MVIYLAPFQRHNRFSAAYLPMQPHNKQKINGWDGMQKHTCASC